MTDLKYFPEASDEFRAPMLEQWKVLQRKNPNGIYGYITALNFQFAVQMFTHHDTYMIFVPVLADIFLLGLFIYKRDVRRQIKSIEKAEKRVPLWEVSPESFEIYCESNEIMTGVDRSIYVSMGRLFPISLWKNDSKTGDLLVSMRLLEILEPAELKYFFCQRRASYEPSNFRKIRNGLGFTLFGASGICLLVSYYFLEELPLNDFGSKILMAGLSLLLVASATFMFDEKSTDPISDVAALKATADLASAESTIIKISIDSQKFVSRNLNISHPKVVGRIDNLRLNAVKLGITVGISVVKLRQGMGAYERS